MAGSRAKASRVSRRGPSSLWRVGGWIYRALHPNTVRRFARLQLRFHWLYYIPLLLVFDATQGVKACLLRSGFFLCVRVGTL